MKEFKKILNLISYKLLKNSFFFVSFFCEKERNKENSLAGAKSPNGYLELQYVFSALRNSLQGHSSYPCLTLKQSSGFFENTNYNSSFLQWAEVRHLIKNCTSELNVGLFNNKN